MGLFIPYICEVYLKSLSILNFKNYSSADAEFDVKLNCLVGVNGSGKTNLLDAIYYLAFCKSFFNPSDIQNILEGTDFFSINGTFNNDVEEKINCSMKKGHKKVMRRNGKNYERFADHIGLIPLVMISPIDILLLIDGSETRRKWIDGIISQFDKNYLDRLLEYNRALIQRNALLKQFRQGRKADTGSLELWDDYLVMNGEYIHKMRKAMLAELVGFFNDYHQSICSSKEHCGIEYQSHLDGSEPFASQLKKSVDRDIQLQYTTVGIHKDELEMTLNGRAVKKFASQGQQKTVLLALRLAQARLISEKSGLRPLMLLDDIYDKLDSVRMGKLLELLNTDAFGQLFITDTNLEHMRELMKRGGMNGKFFSVEEGKVGEFTRHGKKAEVLN